MLSSLRLAITRPAFAATRAFSATPIVKDDLFVRPTSPFSPLAPAAPSTDHYTALPPFLQPLHQMRGLPFHWEHRDLEQFLQEQDVKFDRISLPKSDRRAFPPLLLLVSTLPPKPGLYRRILGCSRFVTELLGSRVRFERWVEGRNVELTFGSIPPLPPFLALLPSTGPTGNRGYALVPLSSASLRGFRRRWCYGRFCIAVG